MAGSTGGHGERRTARIAETRRGSRRVGGNSTPGRSTQALVVIGSVATLLGISYAGSHLAGKADAQPSSPSEQAAAVSTMQPGVVPPVADATSPAAPNDTTGAGGAAGTTGASTSPTGCGLGEPLTTYLGAADQLKADWMGLRDTLAAYESGTSSAAAAASDMKKLADVAQDDVSSYYLGKANLGYALASCGTTCEKDAPAIQRYLGAADAVADLTRAQRGDKGMPTRRYEATDKAYLDVWKDYLGKAAGPLGQLDTIAVPVATCR